MKTTDDKSILSAIEPSPAQWNAGAEAAGWQLQFKDGCWSKAIYEQEELATMRLTNVAVIRPLYAGMPLPLPTPAGE